MAAKQAHCCLFHQLNSPIAGGGSCGLPGRTTRSTSATAQEISASECPRAGLLAAQAACGVFQDGPFELNLVGPNPHRAPVRTGRLNIKLDFQSRMAGCVGPHRKAREIVQGAPASPRSGEAPLQAGGWQPAWGQPGAIRRTTEGPGSSKRELQGSSTGWAAPRFRPVCRRLCSVTSFADLWLEGSSNTGIGTSAS